MTKIWAENLAFLLKTSKIEISIDINKKIFIAATGIVRTFEYYKYLIEQRRQKQAILEYIKFLSPPPSGNSGRAHLWTLSQKKKTQEYSESL